MAISKDDQGQLPNQITCIGRCGFARISGHALFTTAFFTPSNHASMKHTKEEIASAFSNGNFEITFPYLAEAITWTVIGEKEFQGKAAVVENCEQTAKYFSSVETKFKTIDIIAAKNNVVIQGTGEFLKDGKRTNLITACDVYEFSDADELIKIVSYCIPIEK